MKTSSVFLLAVVLFVTSCAASLPIRELKVGSSVFQTEMALTPEDREMGLMNRSSMPENHAMLFVFPDEQQRIFWMKNTQIPLSIAYISKQGVVKEIVDMTPFSLAPVPSRHSVLYALEVNQGAFSRQGVKVGDQLDLGALKGLSEAR